MEPRKCLIVDDEPAAHYVLVNYIRQHTTLEIAKQCYNGIDAMNYLRENPVDLMFLDIDMPELNGLEMLKVIPSPPKTILTTAYSEFALQSYDYGVVDYLLKPIEFARFLKAIERYFSFNEIRKTENKNHYVSIKADGKVFELDSRKILFAQSYGNYVKIFTMEKTYLASTTTNELERDLPQEDFLRVHKSYIIALEKIESASRDMVIINNEKIPIGITYKRELMEKLKNKGPAF